RPGRRRTRRAIAFEFVLQRVDRPFQGPHVAFPERGDPSTPAPTVRRIGAHEHVDEYAVAPLLQPHLGGPDELTGDLPAQTLHATILVGGQCEPWPAPPPPTGIAQDRRELGAAYDEERFVDHVDQGHPISVRRGSDR